MSNSRRADPWARAFFWTALVVGLVRFFRIGAWSLWIDEVYTWGDAHSDLRGNYNDLGYVLVRWFVETFSGGVPTEAALRTLPAIFGYLCIPLTVFAASPVAGPRRAGLAALFVALSAWQIQWSQTARFYTMCQAVTLLGAGVALRGVRRAHVLTILGGVLITGAGAAFHLQGAILAAALGIAAAIACPFPRPHRADDEANGARAPRSPGRAAGIALLALGVAALASLPWVWGAWQRYADQKGTPDVLPGLAHFAQSTAWFVTPALAALSVAGILFALSGRDRGAAFVCAFVGTGTIALLGAASLAVVSAQYAFALFPWVAVLAAWPVGGAFRDQRPFTFAWALVGALPLLASTFLYFTVEHGQRPRWRDAVELVDSLRAPTDAVGATPAPVAEFYLTGGTETDVRYHDTVMHLDERDWDMVLPYADRGRTIWMIVRADFLNTFPPPARDAYRTFLRERCRHVRQFPVRVEARDLTIDVWRYERDR